VELNTPAPAPALAPAPAVAGALNLHSTSGSSPSVMTTPMGFEAKDPYPSVDPVIVPASRGDVSPPPEPSVELPSEPPIPAASDFSLTAEPMALLLRRWRLAWPQHLQLPRKLPAHALTVGGAAVVAALIVLVASLLQSREPIAFAAANAARHPPPPLPEPAPVEPAPTEPLAPFVVSTAWRALYATSRQVADCRRGGVWGGTTATVTFGSDGSVTKIAFRRPFTGSATASCVSDVLRSVRTEPFAGESGLVDFWFYVNSRPR
jgi:hypothetical protein